MRKSQLVAFIGAAVFCQNQSFAQENEVAGTEEKGQIESQALPKSSADSASTQEMDEGNGDSPSVSPTNGGGAIEASAQDGGAGFAFHPNFMFGTMTKDGKTWTRLSFRPEIEVGKFGVALDMEVFMNDKNQFDSYGWQFGSKEEGLESILRKIYYVRWAHPGDPVYAKIGSLDNVTLGYGMLMNNYGNTALYPDRKLLGTHVQLNDIGALKIGVEGITNNFQDWQNGGALLGGRLSLAPLAPTSLPLFGRLRIGIAAVKDFNQYAGLADKDGDKCPDLLDRAPSNRFKCAKNIPPFEDFSAPDSISLGEAKKQYTMLDSTLSAPIKNLISKEAPFTLMSVDASLPIIQGDMIQFTVFTELGFAIEREGESKLFDGYGLTLPGLLAKLWILTARLEYRYIQLPFYPGNFNAIYEAERSVVSGDTIMTKEAKYWKKGKADHEQGVFGSATVDLKGIVEVGGSYKYMIPDAGKSNQGYTGKIALGKSIASLIPKLSAAELFYVKENVGRDLNRDGDTGSVDGFFEPNSYTYYGYTIGILAAPSLTVSITNVNTFYRDGNRKLKSKPNMSLETKVSF